MDTSPVVKMLESAGLRQQTIVLAERLDGGDVQDMAIVFATLLSHGLSYLPGGVNFYDEDMPSFLQDGETMPTAPASFAMGVILAMPTVGWEIAGQMSEIDDTIRGRDENGFQNPIVF